METLSDLNIKVERRHGVFYAYIPDEEYFDSALAVETGNSPREAIVNLLDLIDLA